MSMELILVRHATSTRARIGIWGRLFDAPLEDGFEGQLAQTRSAMASIHGQKVFSSPLARCRQTAAFVYPRANIQLVEEFRAYHSGFFEGKTEDFVRKHFPDYLDLSYRERFLQPKFDEESVSAQAGRVGRGLLKVFRERLQVSVVVAHYSTINVIAHVGSLNWDVGTYADGIYDLAEGSFIRVAIDPVAIVAGLRQWSDRRE